MTWATFKLSVRQLLPVESERLNVGVGANNLFDLFTRLGVIELQSLVPSLRVGHETLFHLADVTVDEQACFGSVPDGAVLREAYYINDTTRCYREPLRSYPWDNRYDLICGASGYNAIAVDPQGETFILYPALTAGYSLSLIWDGTKLDFADADLVPFDEVCVQAVADFVGARIARQVDQDFQMYESLMASFLRKSGHIYVDENDKSRFLDIESSPAGAICAPCDTDAVAAAAAASGTCTCPITVYTDITELKTVTTMVDEDVADVLGIGGGAFGFFYYDADSALAGNDTTVILPNSSAGNGRWIKQVLAAGATLTGLGMVNIKDHGALVDGVTDDTVAWGLALTEAKALGRNVYLPAGTSRITAQLEWPDQGSNMGIVGDGVGISVLVCDFGGTPLTSAGIRFNPTATTSNILLKDFTIRGAVDNDTAVYELITVVDRIYDLRIENVEFAYARHAGFRISTAGNPGARITVKNCIFRDIIDSNVALTAGAAILTTGYSDVEFTGCKYRNCGNGNFSHAVYTQEAIGLKICRNSFDGANSRLHLTGTANIGVLVSGNSFRDQVRNFVSGTGVIVTGNTFWETNLRLNDIIGVHVHGNFFQTSTGQDQIDTIGTPDYVTIEDNDFIYTGAVRTAFGNGFSTDLSTTHLLIQNNRCRNMKLCRINAGVLPVIFDNYIYADGVDEAAGFITLNSTATIDTVEIRRNKFIFITPVGVPRAIEIVGMALGTITCEDNQLSGGSTIGCVNAGWSQQNSKLVYQYSLAGTIKYLKLSLDGTSTVWSHDGTTP